MASHVINNIADSYAYEHDAMEWKNEIKSIAEKYDNQLFYIFRLLCKKKNFMILNKPDKWKYTIEVQSQKKYHFLKHLKKCCFLKVVRRRITKELLNSEFLDEIHVTIVVYK